MAVRPLHSEPSASEPSVPQGVIARPVAGAFTAVDQWDVLLIMGVVMLVTGVGLVVGALVSVVVGIGAALGTGGVLFAMGGLWGARNSSVSVDENVGITR